LLTLVLVLSFSLLCSARFHFSNLFRGVTKYETEDDFDQDLFGSTGLDSSFSEEKYYSRFDESRHTLIERLLKLNRFSSRFIYVTNNQTLKKVPSVFCLPEEALNGTGPSNMTGPSDFGDCQWLSYAESLALVPAAMLIVALIIFPCLQFWCLSIRCCSCKMLQPHTGCCCGEYERFDPKKDGYTNGTVCCTFCAALIFFVLLGFGGAVGAYDHLQLNQDVGNFTDFANDTIQTASNLVTVVNSTVNRLAKEYPEYVDIDISDIADSVNSTIGTINEYMDIGVYYIDYTAFYRDLATYGLYGIPLFLAFLVLLARCCGCCCGCPMITFGYLFTFIFLVLFSVFFPVSTALSDACIYADSLLNESSSEYKKEIANFFTCKRDSPFVNLTKTVRDSVDSVVDTVCNEIKYLDSIQSVPCDANEDGLIRDNEKCQILVIPPNIGKCTMYNLRNYLNYSFKTYPVGCYYVEPISGEMAAVPSSCGDPAIHDVFASENCSSLYPGYPYVRSMYCGASNGTYSLLRPELAKEIQDPLIAGNFSTLSRMVGAGADLLDVYIENIYPYLRCQVIINVTNYAREFVCVSGLTASSLFYVAQAILAVSTLGATATAVYAIKRFRKQNRQKYGNMSEEEDGDEMDALADIPPPERSTSLNNTKNKENENVDVVYSDGCYSPPPEL